MAKFSHFNENNAYPIVTYEISPQPAEIFSKVVDYIKSAVSTANR